MKPVLVLFTCVFAAVTVPAAVLENPAIAIEFRGETEGLGVAAITDKASGVRFVAGAETGADLWAIVFHRKDAEGKIEECRLDNRAPCASREIVKEKNLWKLVWKGLDLPGEAGAVDVTAAVKLAGNSPASAWTISVDCRSSSWGLFETQYPYLRKIVANGEADVMLPAQMLGERVWRKHAAPAAPEEFNYPGWYPMVAAYMKGGAGLYFAAHDPDSRNKRLIAMKDHDLRLETMVENAGLAGKAAKGPGYPVVIATYRGDWWQAAKLYRRWALKQKWCAKGKLADRGDHPRRMSESHAWTLTIGSPRSCSNFVAQVKARYPDAKLAIEWTQWANQPFDVDYPEMLPGQKGTELTCRFATEAGLPLMPYANGRLWDTELCSWYYAKNDCTVDEKGAFNTETYGPKRTFGVMCPFTKGWQEGFGEYVKRFAKVTECGLVYLDQIACSRPKPCFNPAHGHTLGGGHWWADGQRKLLGPVHGELAAKNVPITSEGAGEYLIDVIDGYLLACAPRFEDVPFYTAVYGGYATYYGSFLKEGVAFPSYFAVHARAWSWGVEPGWCHGWPMAAKYREFGDALVALSKAREEAAEFLAYGSLEGEVKFAEPVENLPFEWMNPMSGTFVFKGEFPAVTGTWWLDARGERRAVALVNNSAAERKVTFAAPFRGTAALPPYSVKVVKEP